MGAELFVYFVFALGISAVSMLIGFNHGKRHAHALMHKTASQGVVLMRKAGDMLKEKYGAEVEEFYRSSLIILTLEERVKTEMSAMFKDKKDIPNIQVIHASKDEMVKIKETLGK